MIVASGGGSGRMPVNTGITAATTQTQAAATQLLYGYNRVDTVGTAYDGVKLPSASLGREVIVECSASLRCAVYPSSGDDLGNGDDTATHLLPGQTARWVCTAASTWREVPGPGGLLQHVVVPNTGAGNEASTLENSPMETTLAVVDFRPRYSSSTIKVHGHIYMLTQPNGTSTTRREGQVQLQKDSTAGAGNAANGSVLGSSTGGPTVTAADTDRPINRFALPFAAEEDASTLSDRDYIVCIRGIAADVDPTYTNNSAGLSRIVVEEYAA